MPFESSHFRLELLAPGVYAAVARPGGWAWSNAGIIDLGGYTLVFDTLFTPAAGEDLRRAAEIVTGRSVTWVINSSYRLLHVGGNQAFPNAAILSTAAARQMLADRICTLMTVWRKNPAPLLEEIRGGRVRSDDEQAGMDRTLLEMLPGLHISLPEQTFSGPMELHGALRSVVARPIEGHPAGACTLHVLDEDIVFAGSVESSEDPTRVRIVPGEGEL